jgi:hypothetical protein
MRRWWMDWEIIGLCALGLLVFVGFLAICGDDVDGDEILP